MPGIFRLPPEQGGLWLPGLSGNYASTPDTADLDVTDLDVRADVRLADWSPSADGAIVGKMASGNQRSWLLRVSTAGNLQIVWSEDGTSTFKTASSTAVLASLPANTRRWVRGTLDVDNGAGGYTANFYTSLDGVTWEPLGGPVVGGAPTTIFAGTANLEVGATEGGTQRIAQGHTIYEVELLDGIDGSVVANPVFNHPPSEWVMNGMTMYDGHRVWTINGTRWQWRR